MYIIHNIIYGSYEPYTPVLSPDPTVVDSINIRLGKELSYTCTHAHCACDSIYTHNGVIEEVITMFPVCYTSIQQNIVYRDRGST